MPTIRRELLDDAIRQHFVSNHVVDTEESVRRERDRLMGLRNDEAALIRDELKQVQEDGNRVSTLARKARRDYEAGDLTAKLYSELSADYEREQARCQAAVERLRSSLAAVEGSVPVEQLNALLDAVSSARRMIAGALEGADVPRMNAKLHEVFDSITVSLRDDRLVVVPHLRDESPMTRVLDFSDGTESQPPEVQVVGNLVLRKVELTRPEGVDDASSPW
jgi:hypothetical protein